MTSKEFKVVGVHYLEIMFSTSYYLLVLPYKFKWDDGVGKLKLIESTFQKIVCATSSILMTLGYFGYVVGGVSGLSSNKEDLWKCFATVTWASSTFGCVIMVYCVLRQKQDFLRFLSALSVTDVYPRKDYDKTRRKKLSLRMAAVLFCIPMLYSAAVPLWIHGYHKLSQKLYNNWSHIAFRAFPILHTLIPEPLRLFLSYLSVIFSFHSYIMFYINLLLQVGFAIFLRVNLKTFKAYLSELEGNENLLCKDLFSVYLSFKNFVNCSNALLGPRFLALVIQTVPFCSYLFSEFSALAKEQELNELYMMVFWIFAVSFIYLIAADAASQTGEIKEILVNGKRRFEGMFLEPSEYFAILSNLSTGNEFGISCCRCVVIDYTFVNGMITSILTFSVILIQAKPSISSAY